MIKSNLKVFIVWQRDNPGEKREIHARNIQEAADFAHMQDVCDGKDKGISYSIKEISADLLIDKN